MVNENMEASMKQNKKAKIPPYIKRLGTVTYTYTGTDQDFDEFLKMLLRAYLAADHPYSAETRNC